FHIGLVRIIDKKHILPFNSVDDWLSQLTCYRRATPTAPNSVLSLNKVLTYIICTVHYNSAFVGVIIVTSIHSDKLQRVTVGPVISRFCNIETHAALQ